MGKCGTLADFDTSKFTVIKNDDIERYLAKEDANELKALIRRLSVSRKCNGNNKKDNTYLVVNTDEFYAKDVAEIMKQHGHHS